MDQQPHYKLSIKQHYSLNENDEADERDSEYSKSSFRDLTHVQEADEASSLMDTTVKDNENSM